MWGAWAPPKPVGQAPPLPPVSAPGPGRGTALKAKLGMGWCSACGLRLGSVSWGGGEPRGCGPWRETGPGEEGGTCSGLQLGEGAGKVRGCPRSEPGLHHDSGDWEEGGAAELRGAVSALRLRSSQGTGSSRRKQVGSTGAGPEAGSMASATAAQVALAEPWELVA